MLLDIYHTESVYKEYERRLNADLLARALLKASAEHTKTMTHGANHSRHFVIDLVTTPWHWGRRIARRWSSQPVALALPSKHQL